MFKKNPDLVVFTNVPLKFPTHKRGTELIQYHYSDLLELKPFFLYAINQSHDVLAKHTRVIIDEASVMLSSRTFAQLPAFMISFLAQARHINTDFCFTTQAVGRVEKIVRELTNDWVYCSKIPLLGWITHENETIATDGRILSRSKGSTLFNPKRFYNFYDTYHVINYGEHQEKESEKGIKAPAKLEAFLDFAYVETHDKIERFKSKENGMMDKIKYFFKKHAPFLTKESIIIKCRDDIITKCVYK